MERLRQILADVARPAGVVGLFALVVAGIFYLVEPTIGGYIQPLLLIGLVLILIFVLGSLRELRDLLAGRQTRYGTNTTVMVLAFVGIIVIINLVVLRNNQRLDLTAARQFTLSPQTVKLLQGLKEPIKVVGFFSADSRDLGLERSARDLLKEYRNFTDKISDEYVDPFTQPAMVNQYGVRSDGSIVFDKGGTTQIVSRIDEQTFTSALIKVTRGQQKKVYFLSGHGEREYNDFRDFGYGEMTQALRTDNYAVEPLNLVISPTVPSDAALLVVADPKKALAKEELTAIQDYLKRAGNALILLEPRSSMGLEQVLAQWRVTISDGIVIDPGSSLLGDPATPVIQRYQITDITRDLPLSFFPRPTVITSPLEFGRLITDVAGLEGGIRVEPLALTSERSWLETDPSLAQFDAGVDVPGPLPIAVMVQQVIPRPPGTPVSEQRKGARLVVFGDADFASNQLLYRFGNRDLFLNAVNWLAEEVELIGVRPKPPDIRRVFLGQIEANLVFITSAGILPLAVLLTGGVVWWRRR